MESMDLEVLRTLARWLDQGHQARLVTVVRTWGSSPRPVGSLLGVRSDGALVGSVSGGCVEDDLIERVRSDALASRLPQVLTYGVTQEEGRRFGLPCGGTLQLVVEPLASVHGLKRILGAIEQGQVVARRLRMLTGLADIRPATHDQELSFDGDVLLSVYGPRWRLLIIGAGQVSRYLAEMAMALDYQVTVCDPREEYLPAWGVPNAALVRGMPDDVVREMRPDRRTAIVCLSHDPKLDDMALLEALISDAFYVGAIGSQSNTEKRLARLALFDIGEVELARLHGPVGLPIGSKTPPEIAVSILAEMTAVRHGVCPERHGAMPRTSRHNLEFIA